MARRTPQPPPVAPVYREETAWIEAYVDAMGSVIHAGDHPRDEAACPMCGFEGWVHQFPPAFQEIAGRGVHHRCPHCARLLGYTSAAEKAWSARRGQDEDDEAEEERQIWDDEV
jgi:predicted RNA-binding Zn-ribbon protein involved in translation (DUF1610 family)